MNSIQHIDELIKEYLLFRGFTNTYKAFEAESKTDKDKGFQAEKIIEELFACISAFDVNALLEYWRYLDLRYFSRLDHRFSSSVRKFELCLLRYYLVYAIQHKRREKVVEFFDTHGADLQGNIEWVRWFALPFSKKPEADPEFDLFFSKAWLDTFTVSLHNLLSTVFQSMPLPNLLCFNLDRLHRKALQTEIESLQGTIEALKKEARASDAEISSLREQVALKKVNGARRRRAASMVDQVSTKNQDSGSDAEGSSSKPKSSLGTSRTRAGTDSSMSKGRSQKSSSTAVTLKVRADDDDEDGDDDDETSLDSGDDDDGGAQADEPFVIVSQETFLEHQSGITHARFSCEGNLIASCDAENIVRVWTYIGSSTMTPAKIPNHHCNILSLAWETRDRYVFLGTDESLVRCYNLDARAVVQEVRTSASFPRVCHMTYSPVEPLLVCAVSSRDDTQGALLSINMKTMATEHTVTLEPGAENIINTIGFNHNGQLLVAGDAGGKIRIYDIRSLSQIMEWEASASAILSATFSFDETTILSIDNDGHLMQHLVHKPGEQRESFPLQGFLTSTLSESMMTVASSGASVKSSGSRSFRTTTTSTTTTATGTAAAASGSGSPFTATTKGTPLSTMLPRTMSGGGSSSSASAPRIQFDTRTGSTGDISAVTQAESKSTGAFMAMNIGPGQLLSWSGDTEHLLMGCGNAGVIMQTLDGRQVQPLMSHAQPLTCVDWSTVVGACLTGAADGTIKVSKLMRI
ncbi:WD repeat-containing protein 91 [Actinomortierella ambigua]|nr:WD repeat-containing protein 91 [Actinomortierella ambigua]